MATPPISKSNSDWLYDVERDRYVDARGNVRPRMGLFDQFGGCPPVPPDFMAAYQAKQREALLRQQGIGAGSMANQLMHDPHLIGPMSNPRVGQGAEDQDSQLTTQEKVLLLCSK